MPLVPYNSAAGVEWNLYKSERGTYDQDEVNQALLMDIRAELRKLNALLACPNFLSIPHSLKAINKNTEKRRRVRR